MARAGCRVLYRTVSQTDAGLQEGCHHSPMYNTMAVCNSSALDVEGIE